jgi:hypothetical protein
MRSLVLEDGVRLHLHLHLPARAGLLWMRINLKYRLREGYTSRCSRGRRTGYDNLLILTSSTRISTDGPDKLSQIILEKLLHGVLDR